MIQRKNRAKVPIDTPPRQIAQGTQSAPASALNASGLDVLSISRRLGRGSLSITLTIYSHLFTDKGREAASPIEAVLGEEAIGPPGCQLGASFAFCLPRG
jgi:hypothetical protein